MDDIIVTKLENVTDDFWVEVNQEYIINFQSITESLENYLQSIIIKYKIIFSLF